MRTRQKEPTRQGNARGDPHSVADAIGRLKAEG